jgi:hypothetical protein
VSAGSPDAPKPAPPSGAVYSLAYSRYAGPRRSPSFAPLVIARYALMAQLRQRGVKVALLLGLLLLTVCAAGLGFSWSLPAMVAGAGFGSGPGAAQLAELVRDGEADVVRWTLRAQLLPTFLLVLWCGAGAISADLMAGAFQFHFSRPVSPARYLMGRMLSASGWAFALSAATAAVLSVERLAFGSTPFGAARAGATALLGVLLELSAASAVALAVSSITRRKGLAQAMFAALALAGWVLTRSLGVAMDARWLRTVDLLSCADGVVSLLAGASRLEGARAAAGPIAWAAWTSGGLALAWWRLSRAEVNRG